MMPFSMPKQLYDLALLDVIILWPLIQEKGLASERGLLQALAVILLVDLACVQRVRIQWRRN